MQREEFKRLGVEGDWDHPYTTMDFAAEAQIARELMKFAQNGTLYRGSKPVMWSVVEKTALAEAEVEYEDYVSDQVWVKFPVRSDGAPGWLRSASIVIWTTTPWTIPGNRAISFSPKIEYGLYEVTDAPSDNWATRGDLLVLADKLARRRAPASPRHRVQEAPRRQRRGSGGADLRSSPRRACAPATTSRCRCSPATMSPTMPAPASSTPRPVTAATTSRSGPANAAKLAARGINTTIPYTVDADGRFTDHAPGFTGKRVLTDKGEKGDANDAVIKALVEAGMLIGRGRLKHQYPHSWRSKKPVIFRNTPQWFIAMDKPIADAAGKPAAMPIADAEGQAKANDTLRQRALEAIKVTRWVPDAGREPHHRHGREQARLGDLAPARLGRADHGVRAREQRRLGRDPRRRAGQQAHRRCLRAGRRGRLVRDRRRARASSSPTTIPTSGRRSTTSSTSGSIRARTHAFVLEDPVHFPSLAGIKRKMDGGPDTVMYLEGSDQHRGWFQSSLLESCGTRGRAPFDVVLTHGFVLDENGRKMSKSLGNVTAPQDVIKQSGADILRMWCCASDYADDLRIGPEILKTTVETYRKLRNTFRWMLGSLAHFRDEDRRPAGEDARARAADAASARRARRPGAPRLRRLRLQAHLRRAQRVHDLDLSAFYFDIRKDALYCDPISSTTRKACLTVIDQLFRATVTWLAPMLPFTAEEAWLARYPVRGGLRASRDVSPVPAAWRDDALAEKWRKVRTGAPRRHRRARDRAGTEAHRLLARGRSLRLRRRPRPVRRNRRHRPGGDLDHLGRDAGRGRRTGRRVPARRGQGRGGRGAARRRPQMRAVVEDPAERRLRSGLSRRLPARCPGAARMGRDAQYSSVA